MKRKAQQGMQSSTAPQTLQNLKTQLQSLQNLNLPEQLNTLTNTVEQLEAQVQQLEQMRLQQQQQVQQMQQQTQQQADDQLPGGRGDKLSEEDVDKEELEKGIKEELEHTGDRGLAKEIALDHLAEDPKYYTMLEKMHSKEDDAMDWKLMLGRTWKEIQDLFGGENRYDDYDVPNAVSGVRGELKSDLTAGKKKKKKERHLSPRDKEHNKDLPDFWRRNYDYGESPYMNLEKLEKITDKPPFSKRVKKKK